MIRTAGFRCAALLAAMLGLLAARAVPADENATVFGPDATLSAAVQALMLRDYATGVELTLEGLPRARDRRQRGAALSNLCAGFGGLGQFQEALAACDEAIRLRPGLWRAYNNRAIAHLGLGQLAEARRDLEAGLALNPESGQLRQVAEMLAAREAELHLTLAATD